MNYSEICKQYGIFLYQFSGNEKDARQNINKSGSMSFDRYIEIGIYENKELENLSFLHELAHVLFNKQFYQDNPENNEVYDLEKFIWDKTYELAKEYQLKFSDLVKKEAINQLNTYAILSEDEKSKQRFSMMFRRNVEIEMEKMMKELHKS